MTRNITDESINKPVLIYFKIRGHAQIIREVLLEIGVEFDEVFVTDNGYLDPSIINKYEIEIQKLPYLIHNGAAHHDTLSILKYICTIYDRLDLFGRNLDDYHKIAQVLMKYSKEKNLAMSVLVKGLKEIQTRHLGDEAYSKLSEILNSISSMSKYCQASQKMFQSTGQYLCGYLTILDFIFYEQCFYYANMRTANDHPSGQIRKRYVQFFENSYLYQRNKEYLEEYKILIYEPETSPMLQKMWIGDKKFLGLVI